MQIKINQFIFLTMNNINILNTDLKTYVVNNTCKFLHNGYILESKNSKLIFDLSQFNFESCTILIKRLSGNGKFLINEEEVSVLSKIENKVNVNLPDNKKITFTRSIYSSGQILIYGIIIEKAKENCDKNWKQILSTCGQIKGISLIKNKLLATEGAFIQRGDLIESILTDPVNAYIHLNEIKFIYSCEIKDIILKEDSINYEKQMYHHFNIKNAETKVLPKTNLNKTNYLTKYTENIKNKNNIIFDSSNFFNLDNFLNVKEVENKGNYLLVNRFGKFSIKLEKAIPNTQYVIAITCRKHSGNGKLSIGFSKNKDLKITESIFVCRNNSKTFYLKLNTDSYLDKNDNYLLDVFRPTNNSVGEVIIEKIMVIGGITIEQNNIVNTISNDNITQVNNKNNIKDISKKFARYQSYELSNYLFDFAGSIIATNLSSLLWFSKIYPACKDFKLNNDISNATFLMGGCGNLLPVKKIWLEPFNEISENDKEIISNAELIISPSEKNIEDLSKITKAKLILSERPWPVIPQTKIILPFNEYIFLIHRSNDITKKFFDCYTHDMPKVIICGYDGKLPEFSVNINEYITYDKFLYVLLNSKLIIDSLNNNLSGFNSLIKSSGIPFIQINDNYHISDLNKDIIKNIDVINENNLNEHNKKVESFFNLFI